MNFYDITVGDYIMSNSTSRVARVMSVNPTRDSISVRTLLRPESLIEMDRGAFYKFGFQRLILRISHLGVNSFTDESQNDVPCPAWVHNVGMPEILKIAGGTHKMLKPLDAALAAMGEDFAKPPRVDLFCKHTWRATHLFFSVVYDCSICGAKREDV